MTIGFLYFDDAPLSDIATAIGRWYNVNVEFTDIMRKIDDYNCSMYYENTSYQYASLVAGHAL